MAETGIAYTLTTPGGTITFNTESVFVVGDPYAGSAYVGDAYVGVAHVGAVFAPVLLPPDNNTYTLNEVAGLDMPLIRLGSENLPQRDGAVIVDGYMGARSPSFAGVLVPGDGNTTSRRMMEDELRAALLSIVHQDGILEWTPTDTELGIVPGSYADAAYADAAMAT